MSDTKLIERLERLEAEVGALRAKQEITEVLYRASRAVDRCDVEMMASCWHPGGTDYRGVANGPAEYTRNSLKNWPVTISRHVNANITIELDGDVARVESYVDAFHYFPEQRDGKGQHEFIQARYMDRFEKRNGAWKIARRITVWDRSWIEPSHESWYDFASGAYVTDKHFIMGRRDKQDVVYHFRLPPELQHHEPNAKY